MKYIDYRYELRTLILAYRTGTITREQYHSAAVPIRAALNAMKGAK